MQTSPNAPITQVSATTVDPEEIKKFQQMADEWWDERGKFKPLHMFNPIRLSYMKEVIAGHCHKNQQEKQPLAGISLLDVGCGGGLVAEPFARLGADVTGIDAGEVNIQVARLHAARSELMIHYQCDTAEAHSKVGKQYDVVCALEIIEHVADVSLFIESLAKLVKPGGLLLVSTINRTLKSLALAKFGAEYVLGWLPKGTHDWQKFIKPSELTSWIEQQGLVVANVQGMAFHPLKWEWMLSTDADMNYTVVASKPR